MRGIACALALFFLTSCGGGRLYFLPNGVTRANWGGFVVSPTTQFIVLQPGQTLVIIVQQAPAFFFGPPAFFSNFNGANPNLALLCPGIGSIGDTLIVNNGTFIQITFSPVGPGTCFMPLDLGANGSVGFNVQVIGGGAKAKRY